MYQESHKIELSKEFPGNKCLWWNYNPNGIASQIIYALLAMSASSDRGKQVGFHSPVGGVHHTSRFCQQGEGNIQQETGDGKLKLIVNQSEDGDHWDLCILYKGLTYLLWEKKLKLHKVIWLLCYTLLSDYRHTDQYLIPLSRSCRSALLRAVIMPRG